MLPRASRGFLVPETRRMEKALDGAALIHFLAEHPRLLWAGPWGAVAVFLWKEHYDVLKTTPATERNSTNDDDTKLWRRGAAQSRREIFKPGASLQTLISTGCFFFNAGQRATFRDGIGFMNSSASETVPASRILAASGMPMGGSRKSDWGWAHHRLLAETCADAHITAVVTFRPDQILNAGEDTAALVQTSHFKLFDFLFRAPFPAAGLDRSWRVKFFLAFIPPRWLRGAWWSDCSQSHAGTSSNIEWSEEVRLKTPEHVWSTITARCTPTGAAVRLTLCCRKQVDGRSKKAVHRGQKA